MPRAFRFEVGPDRVVEKLQGLAGVHGPRLEPSPGLMAAAARQGFAPTAPDA